jgi:hypothetical protein
MDAESLLEISEYPQSTALPFLLESFSIFCGKLPTFADTRSAERTINWRRLDKVRGGYFEAQ